MNEYAGAFLQAFLKLRGISQVALSKKLQINPTTISLVIRGKRRSKYIEDSIARFIGCPAENIWPKTKRMPFRKSSSANNNEQNH